VRYFIECGRWLHFVKYAENSTHKRKKHEPESNSLISFRKVKD
jgi:hypothetical protein